MKPIIPEVDDLISSLAKKITPYVSDNLALVGIHTGGALIAERIRDRLGVDPLKMGSIDISFYRDDYEKRGLKHSVRPSSIGFDVQGREIILIDDVLYSGRTVRAALNEIFDHGRPKKVMLAVLLDRGQRDLPIAADFVGFKLVLSRKEKVSLVKTDQGTLGFIIQEGLR